MFRKMRRVKNELPEEAAQALLQNEKIGIFAVNGDDGYPFAVPVNYLYDREAGKIFFHGAKAGHKVEALQKSDKVCFTVYGNRQFDEGDWAPRLQSTVVFGRCRILNEEPQKQEKLRALAKDYYPSQELIEEEIAKAGREARIYEITIEHMTGKQIREK